MSQPDVASQDVPSHTRQMASTPSHHHEGITHISTFVSSPVLSRVPTIADIWQAAETLRPFAKETPTILSRSLSEITGAQVYLKQENLQRSGSFKLRGASYKIARLSDADCQYGVIAASAGNHAQGVAIAAQMRGIPCTICMPIHAPEAKVQATRGYGASVELFGETYDDAYQYARELQHERKMTFLVLRCSVLFLMPMLS
jgi:threonine dehydratase